MMRWSPPFSDAGVRWPGKESRPHLWTAALIVLLMTGLSLAPDASGGVLHLVPDLLSPSAETEVVAWDHEQTAGERAVLQFRHSDLLQPVAIVQVQNDAGDEVMHAFVEGGALYISDGVDMDGVPHPAVEVGSITGWWQRVDILLHGSDYTFIMDDAPPMTARATTPTTTGTTGDASQVLPHEATVEGPRWYPADSQHEPFREPLAQRPEWHVVTDGGRVEVEEGPGGHRSHGRMVIDADGGLDDIAHAYTSLDGMDGAFIAQVSFRPGTVSVFAADGVPDHQAVLAGIAAPGPSPIVEWALVMAQVGVEHDRWSLFLVDADGHRTQVGPTWRPADSFWHTVEVFVDPSDNVFEVRLDERSDALRFDGEAHGLVTHLAIGDVFKDHLWWTGGGTGYYDNFALYAWEGDA